MQLCTNIFFSSQAAENDSSEWSTANLAAESFHPIYVEHINRKRSEVPDLYLEDGRLIWNGNLREGKAAIREFVTSLPDLNQVILSLNAQPLESKEMKFSRQQG